MEKGTQALGKRQMSNNDLEKVSGGGGIIGYSATVDEYGSGRRTHNVTTIKFDDGGIITINPEDNFNEKIKDYCRQKGYEEASCRSYKRNDSPY